MTEHAGPEQMRSAMAEYVQAVHGAYIDAANALPPGDRARLPLFAAGTFTVIVAGARYLHVLATTDKLVPDGEVVLPTWETLVDEMLSLYAELLGGAGPEGDGAADTE